jgi:hypothetical protein
MLKTVWSGIDPDFVINMDETAVDLEFTPQKVIDRCGIVQAVY